MTKRITKRELAMGEAMIDSVVRGQITTLRKYKKHLYRDCISRTSHQENINNILRFLNWFQTMYGTTPPKPV